MDPTLGEVDEKQSAGKNSGRWFLSAIKNCMADNEESMLDPELLKSMCPYIVKTVFAKALKQY